MRPDDLQAIFIEQETASPSEVYRRIGVFLDALAAMPKPSWRPSADARGIRTEGPGLGRMRRLIGGLDISLEGQKFVHVVGTSGKGSTALMIAASLHAAGRRVAAFFSPHLTSLAERFWICGRFAEAGLAGRCAARIAGEAARMAREEDMGPPSYFEATLALLLLAAGEADCEFIVLEAGLGGTFDATRAAGPAALDVITSVGLDHTDLLGETIGQIARDKAGIITPGGRIIAGALRPEAREEVERTAKERGAGIFSPPGAAAVSPDDEGGCTFDLVFPGGEVWAGVRTPMAGPHQAENAALAAGACRLLGLEESGIRAGIGAARLPCRAERIAPGVVLDGAHNRDKARALVATLGEYPAGRRLFVLGAAGDKDYSGIAEALAGAGDGFYVTLPPGSAQGPGGPRTGGGPRVGVSPAEFARALRGAGATGVTEHIDPWRALEAALEDAGEDDLVVVAGSLYLAGELRKRWVSEERIAETGDAFPPEGWT